MHLLAATLALQSVLSFQIEGPGPVRFGVPLPIDAVEKGLRLRGPPSCSMQWRFLQETPGVGAERVWVEIAVTGAGSDGGTRCRILAGGEGPAAPEREGSGAICTPSVEEIEQESGMRRVEEWRWSGGAVDRRVAVLGGEASPGLSRSETTPGFAGRFLRVRISDSFWREAGVLQRLDGSGVALRRALVTTLPALAERAAAGEEGRGDYVRGDVVTNLEFDTTLALLQLGLATGSEEALRSGVEAGGHLLEVDVDVASGLPYRHGPRHRSRAPEAGHVWIEGLRLCGALTADARMLRGARAMARALASRMRTSRAGEGRFDRLRDEAWPLHELEGHLLFEDSDPVRVACDTLAGRMLERWDPGTGALRYGEGESRSGETYDQRLWLSLGIAAVALERHAERTRSSAARRVVDALRERAVALWSRGRSGLPIRCRVAAGGDVVSVHHARAAPEAVLLLEGIDPGRRVRLLRRAGVRSGLEGLLDPHAPDLATRFTIIARCGWVMR